MQKKAARFLRKSGPTESRWARVFLMKIDGTIIKRAAAAAAAVLGVALTAPIGPSEDYFLGREERARSF